MGIHERIKIWRSHLGLSQSAFCEKTGIPLRTLKGYEAGTRHPGSEALASLADTGLNINWLLTGNGEMLSAPDAGNSKHTLPEDLLEFQENMAHIFSLLLVIDEDKREATIREMLNRVKDAARINELEHMVKKLQKTE